MGGLVVKKVCCCCLELRLVRKWTDGSYSGIDRWKERRSFLSDVVQGPWHHVPLHAAQGVCTCSHLEQRPLGHARNIEKGLYLRTREFVDFHRGYRRAVPGYMWLVATRLVIRDSAYEASIGSQENGVSKMLHLRSLC